jgi:hypothetical protein
MGLLNKITEALANRSPRPSPDELRQEIEDVTKNGRLHVRYQLPETLKAELRFKDGSVAKVKNISYGGLGVELNEKSNSDKLPRDELTEFVALGQKMTFKVSLLRWLVTNEKTVFIGMAFCHDSHEGLHFLRLVIDGLRFGTSLSLLPDTIRKDTYKGTDWHCFRGEGPCDLLIRSNGEKITQALLTFPWNGSYSEIAMINDRISTGELALDSPRADHRPSPQMHTARRLNQETLVRAAWILGSAPKAVQTCARPLLEKILHHIG